MKILTLNTHSYQEANQFEKLDYLADIIIENSYDVIALQEVNQYSSNKFANNEINDSNFLLLLYENLKQKGFKYNYRWDYHHIGYEKYDEGTGILYKEKAVYSHSDFIGSTKDTNFWKTRKFTMISLKLNDEIVDFYSCHLGWWNDLENPFKLQIDNLLDYINQRGNTSFLMGDFNSDASLSSEGYDYLITKKLFDTYNLAQKKDNGITVPGIIDGWTKKDLNPKRIDYIFTTKKIDVISSYVIFNGINKNIISDHFGIEIEIKL